MESERKYPITEGRFKEIIEPFLKEAKQKLETPTHANFISWLKMKIPEIQILQIILLTAP